MKINPTIFRAYDIRGKAFADYDEDGFFVVAAAIGQYFSQKFKITNPKVFVSGDGRISMPQLYPAVIAGLESVGCEVVWGGAIPTPLNYFAFHEGKFDGSIQISASHNPPEDNGLKITDREGAVCGDQIQKIRRLTECSTCNITSSIGECKNQCTPQESFEKYVPKLQSITPKQSPKKLIVDCGNAIPGIFYPDALRQFGHTITPLFCDLNPLFPNHQPDPERLENLRFLIEALKDTPADFGFAFDGDGDRLGVVLSDGQVLSADKILYCLAVDYLSRHPKAKIVVDAMSSATLLEKIKEKGGVPILSKTGHSYIEEAMHEHKALLGGEQSGHFMFGEDFYGHDDALLAALRFLRAVESRPSLLDEVTTGWPNLIEFSEKITVDDTKKFEILDQIIHDIVQKYPQADTTDGVRIDFTDGEWAIVRCSNTSPKIAIRFEAQNQERLEELKNYFLQLFEVHLGEVHF